MQSTRVVYRVYQHLWYACIVCIRTFGSRRPGWVDGWVARNSGLLFLSSESRLNPQIFLMLPQSAYRNDNNLSPRKSRVTDRERQRLTEGESEADEAS